MIQTRLNNGAIYDRVWDVEVDGLKAELRIWCIIGGTLAISFSDHFGSERYNYCAEGDFPYPLPNDFVPYKWYAKPEHFTNGAEDIYNYVRVWHPRRELQLLRSQALGGFVKSRRIHDSGNRVYGTVSIGEKPLPILRNRSSFRFLSPVTGDFPCWWGRVHGTELHLSMPDNWRELAKFADRDNTGTANWLWELSEDEFQEYKRLIEAVRKNP